MTGEVVLLLRVALAGILVGFFVWAFYTLWRDLRNQSAIIRSRQIPSLLIESEAEDQPQVERFTVPEIRIGRDPGSDYRVNDETVSSNHAKLVFHHGQWWLEDLQSTNGTFINQEPLDIPTVILSGDEIRCGQVNLKINIET